MIHAKEKERFKCLVMCLCLIKCVDGLVGNNRSLRNIVDELRKHHSPKYERSSLYDNTTGKYPFQDPTKSWLSRLGDLMQRLTLDEFANQSSTFYFQDPPPISRLGIKPYVWITECLHGHSFTNSTAFPQALGLAATFNSDLVYVIFEAISYEVRAAYNDKLSKKQFATYYGLNCLSPVINIMRHPLWGRNQETYGEDPYLSSILIKSYVKGVQGDERYVRVTAGCKHFAVHGGPDNYPVSRHSFDVNVSKRDLYMTYLPAFKACVKAGTFNVMCSYNRINGTPACANRMLLTEILRNQWNFTGFVISDNKAIKFTQTEHKYFNSSTQAAAGCIKAGCNLELGTDFYWHDAPKAIDRKLLSLDELRESVAPLFFTRLRLGEFDPPSLNPYADIDKSIIQLKATQELAILTAAQSFVLLKNLDKTLPLNKMVKKAAFVGPFANNLDLLYGTYSPNPMPQYGKTVYSGLVGQIANISVLEQGCDDTKCQNYNQDRVKKAVNGCDLVIVCLGLGKYLESEGNDRKHIELPVNQTSLLKDAVKYANGSPVILLLFNAGPVNISWAKHSSAVHVIMACFYPAQSTGDALLYTMSNINNNNVVPAGRLPTTWPQSLDQVPSILDYNMEAGATYRYYKGQPLYPFGYGLSYSTFEYTGITLDPAEIKDGQEISVTVSVLNSGQFDADEVIQLYISWINASIPVPRWTLVGFARPSIKAGTIWQQDFTIEYDQLEVWVNDDIGLQVVPGDMILYVGGQQPFQETNVGSNMLQKKFKVV